MMSLDDKTRRSAENAASNLDLAENHQTSLQDLHAGGLLSETSDAKGNHPAAHEDTNFSHHLERCITNQTLSDSQELLPGEIKAGNGDSSFPNPAGVPEYQLSHDKRTVGDGMNGKIPEQKNLQHAQEENDERNVRHMEVGCQNEGEKPKLRLIQMQLAECPVEKPNRWSFSGHPKWASEQNLESRENSGQLNGQKPKSSHGSLPEIDFGPPSNISGGTQISHGSTEFKSCLESLHDKELESTRSESPEVPGATAKEITRSSWHTLSFNEMLADIISSTEPSIRNLVSQNTPGEYTSSNRESKTYQTPKRLLTPVVEQRHPGKSGLWSDRFMKDIDEIVSWDTRDPNTISLSSTNNQDDFAAYENDENMLSPPQPQEVEAEPTGAAALTVLIIGICLSVFLISLDRTIITTAIPYISGEFKSYADIGWYGSAYLLTACAFQPLYGRIFTLFSIKWSYLAANILFEIGSLICGIAPNSVTLIIGRAIAGVGSAGILTGSFVVVAHSVPMQKRPVFTAAVGLMFGVGATVGPLLGGAFTDLVTWRWCFYFNLPVGGVAILAMIIFFNPRDNRNTKRSVISRVLELDIIGNILLLGACIMLFMALQYTETGYAWSSVMVVGLIVGFGVTIFIFGFWLWWRGDQALIPPAVLKQRSVLASCIFSFFIYSALILHSYYLPQWFQAIKDTSAIASGIDMIPYVICNAFFSLLAGIVVSKYGYFTPPTIIGMAVATIGCGLISTLNTSTMSSQWITYEIISAAGFGMAIQQGFTAVQTVLPLEKIPIGTAAVVASQSFGGAIFVSVGNNILQNQLIASSKDGRLPGVDIQAVLDAGATGFRSVVDADQLPALLTEYNGALQKVFIASVPVTILALIASLFLEWKSVKTHKNGEKV
ncbi:hypothetical protein DSL72_002728 [Monilinia vaccinii-corymbosi]|uniref:Major facilitator superfamily (MFS) profile domain-containing protein n=1 Tax=Monilinia vaccinii-corymbosi TaxID=61207 RepID=A0A8A3PD92_9HELO|nr:hypothetical protein DSL72_002728 [Monilinia vaccinii-corymbosi]